MGIMGIFKERINLNIVAGGDILPVKDLPVPVTGAVLTKGNKKGEIVISVPFAGKKKWKLIDIEWEEAHARNAGKAVVGALAGGVLLGGVGALAGAALGGKRNDVSKAYITLVDEHENEHKVHIQCDQQLYAKLSHMKS